MTHTETLEEAAFESSVDYKPFEDNLTPQEYYEYGFIKGAKWQAKRMYSEEDMRQTAVQWLAYNLGEHGFSMLELDFKTFYKLISQALAMEKEQIIEAFQEGQWSVITSEEYYEETFREMDD
jgi:hypothetical protein